MVGLKVDGGLENLIGISITQEGLETGHQQRAYVPFITDQKEELEYAARCLQREFDLMQQNSGLELVVHQVPDVLSAIDFWRQHFFDTPLLIGDGSNYKSSGTRFKRVHQAVDHQMFTGVVNAYTVRELNGSFRTADEIDPDSFIATTMIELSEMIKPREALREHQNDKEWLECVTKARDTEIERLLLIDGDYVLLGKTAEADLDPATLTQPNILLTTAITDIRQHYGNRANESKAKIELARIRLNHLLSTLPFGITYLTHSAKEGVFAATKVLEGSSEMTFQPVYAIKRFATLAHARHVHRLTQDLIGENEKWQDEHGISYLKIPNTYWPLKVNGYSVLFMDVIVGEDLLELLPKLDQAKKHSVVMSALDNIAYWQNIAMGLADRHGYKQRPDSAYAFPRNSVRGSLRTLEAVTDIELSMAERQLIEQAANNLPELVSPAYALGLDTGLRNIRFGFLHGGATGAHETTDPNSVWQLDLPYEWRTVHEMRDPVRLLFAPASALSMEEVIMYTNYFLLRRDYLNAIDDEESRAEFGQAISRLLYPRDGSPERANYLQPHDILVAAAAEAARMTVIIPNVFLSKVKAEMEGTMPQTIGDLPGKFDELVTETQKWAGIGLTATRQLGDVLRSDQVYIAQGLEVLYSKFERAVIDRGKLPAYKPFMQI